MERLHLAGGSRASLRAAQSDCYFLLDFFFPFLLSPFFLSALLLRHCSEEKLRDRLSHSQPAFERRCNSLHLTALLK